MKTLLMVYLTLSLPALVGCQMLKNRKPQSAGSAAYCSNCLVEQVDKDVADLRNTVQKAGMHFVKNEVVKAPVEVRSVVVFDDNGKPVCRVNLLKHPGLVPSFAKPVTNKMVHQASKAKRGLASVDDESDLPPCSDKYLSELKRMAKNNVVINGNKSYMHKTTSLRKLLGENVAACALGGSAGTYVTKKFIQGDVTGDSARKGIVGAGGGTIGSTSMAIVSDFMINKLTKQLKEGNLPSNERIKINRRIGHLKKIKRGGMMGLSAGACYMIGTHIGFAIYR